MGFAGPEPMKPAPENGHLPHRWPPRPPAVSGESEYLRLSRETLETALAEVPGYAAWRPLDPGPQAPIDERYAALPRLTKTDLRRNFPAGYLRAGTNIDRGLAENRIALVQTSGSTEDQVTLVFDPVWWEASERAAWQLNDHARRVSNGNHAEVVLASPRCVGPGESDRFLLPSERTLGRHFYLNQHADPARWEEGDIRRMALEWNAFSPVVVEADPAYLALFLERAEGLDLSLAWPQLFFLTYSFPSRAALRRIRRTFAVPTASSYGSTETGHVFMECEAGRLHQNTAHCRVDFLPFAATHGGPRRGLPLVTVFHNPWFLPIRFDVGDVALREEAADCPCGRREGLTLAAIEGRLVDVTYAHDGRAVSVDDLDRQLAGLEELLGWQLVLPAPGRYELEMLISTGEPARVCRRARELLHGCFGAGVEVAARVVSALRPEPSGKFRFVRAAFFVDHGHLLERAP